MRVAAPSVKTVGVDEDVGVDESFIAHAIRRA